jgi:MoaA/NifB/PqqE/SkfB family radical SAM enzyme
MLQGLFRRLISRPKRRRFSAWQIELTTRCPLRCKMCIRDAAAQWHTGDMSPDDFMKLVPYLRDVDVAVLEGWGEPLLYKDLTRVIRLVKEAQCQAGFVTSGWGLDDERISELIAAGLDFIGFSLSGGVPETHNVIRANSNLHSVLRSIQVLQELKARRKLAKPKVHIVFLMLRDNVAELPMVLDYGKDLGIDEIVLINLIQVSNAWQEEQKLFNCGEEEEHDVLREVASKARALKIRLRTASISPREVGVCAENPLQNLYISVDGNISPCVYLYPPIPSPFKRIFCGREHAVAKVSFGNIFKEPLEAIWNREAYVAFRHAFFERQRSFKEKYPSIVCRPEGLSRYGPIDLPPPPEPCRTCHKMLGF